MEAFTVRFAQTFLLAVLTCASAQAQGMLGVSSQTASANAPTESDLPGGVRGPFAFSSLSTAKPNGAALPPKSSARELEAAKIIARVGDEVILAGDLLGQVNQFLHNRLQEIPEEQRASITPEALEEQRWKLVEQLLPQSIQGKLMYLDFIRTIPKDRLPEIQDSLYQAFDQQQLPVLIERANVQTAADLDSLLRSFGSSLNQQRLTFSEQLAAAQWRQKHASDTREISHEDLVDYYRKHIEDYRITARAKWEQLTARNDTTGSEEASYRLVGKLGNEVYQGAAFAAVAKRSSHGPTASTGGQYDWTTKGSLRSSVLDEAVFSLPIGRLSQRIKDIDGYHIIRVIERQDESFVPFAEAQEGIREKIEKERSELALQKYTKQLRDEFPVWSIFEEGDPTSVARRNP